MASLEQSRFTEILEAARSRTAVDGVDSILVNAHLAQMRLFMVRQGVEFFARHDSFAQRREFIRRVVDYNELPGRLDAIIDNFLIDGTGLFYFRPSKDLYRLHFFTRNQFRTYYDEEGSLEEVQIIYSFKVRQPRGFGATLGTAQLEGSRYAVSSPSSDIRWIYLRVLADRVEQTTSNTKPDFDQVGTPDKTLINSLGFIPAQEVFNNRGLEGGEGRGEFDLMAPYILRHDKMVRSISGNLDSFGGPTLVSSRPRHDLMEPDGENGNQGKATVSSNSGFMGMNRVSTRSSDPGYSVLSSGLRVPRVIANVEAADRVQFITPDPVSPDQMNYAQMYQEMIRSALGGVDDLSISSGATAFEVRTLYGRVSATAKNKCRDLFEYGLCRIFTMMVVHEETLFRESLAKAIGLEKPEPVLEENLPPDLPPEKVEKIKLAYEGALTKWRQAVAAATQQIKETGEVPPSVVGLIPDGDARIDFRWMGEVFPDSPQEILQNSIVCRNLQELGVSSIEGLQYLFPQKTPEERAAMLSGYPFRMVEATQRSIGIFMDILRGMFQVPHPQQPNFPLAADPNLDLVPYVYRTLSFLQKELSYSGTYSDADPATLPPTLSDADRLRASRGTPTELERERQRRRNDAAIASAGGTAGGAPTVPGGAYTAQLGFGSNWSPVSGGVSGARRLTDASSPIPGVGGTLAFDPGRPDSSAGGQLDSGAAGMGGPGRFGAPDLLAPTNAGLLQPPAGPGGGPGGAKRRPGRSKR